MVRDQLFRIVACGFLDVLSWASISCKSCWMIWGQSHMTWKLSVLPWVPIFWVQNSWSQRSKWEVHSRRVLFHPFSMNFDDSSPKRSNMYSWLFMYMYISTSLCKLVLVCIFRASSSKLEKIGKKRVIPKTQPREATSYVTWLGDFGNISCHGVPVRPRVPVFQSLPKSPVSFLSFLDDFWHRWAGYHWNMMGKNGMLLRLCQFQEFGCCYFGDPTVRGKEYWPLLIAVFGRVLLHQFLNAAGRVATDQVLLYPFCRGLQGWHMKLRTETCCWVSVIS